MKTWALWHPSMPGIIEHVTLCEAHARSMPGCSDTVSIVQAAPAAICDVCRQDRIRALIRAQGSVVA